MARLFCVFFILLSVNFSYAGTNHEHVFSKSDAAELQNPQDEPKVRELKPSANPEYAIKLEEQHSIELSEGLFFYIPGQSFDQQRLLEGGYDEQFERLNKKSLPLPKQEVWLRVTLANQSAMYQHFIVNFEELLFDSIEMFYQSTSHVDQHYFKTGLNFPYDSRPIPYRYMAFPVDINSGEILDVYFKIYSSHVPLIAPVITPQQYFNSGAELSAFISLITIGISIGLCLVALLFAATLRHRLEIFSFWLYLSLTTLVIAGVTGLYSQALGNYPEWHKASFIILLALNCMTNLFMVNSFFDVPKSYPRLQKVYLALYVYFTSFIIFYKPLGGYDALMLPLIGSTIVMFSLLFFTNYLAIKKKVHNAKLYGAGLFLFFFTTLYSALGGEGLVPYNAFIRHCIGLGVCVQALIYCFAIVNKMRGLQKHQRVLEDQVLAATAASNEKSQFLATMSHEIRTPINGILGMSELMADTQLNQQQKNYNNIVQSSANTLLNVINNVLDISKIEAGKVTVKQTIFNCSDLLQELKETFTWQADQKGIRLNVDVNGFEAVQVLQDQQIIRQIVSNYLSNALKFTDEGEVGLKLTIDDGSQNDQVLILEVCDSGIGIAEDDTVRLFESFSQIDSSNTRRYGGTGLGLAISKKLAERIGGQVGFSPNPDGGACFWLKVSSERLPLLSESEGVEKVMESPIQLPWKVLIVEDNPTNVLVLKGMLEKLGVTYVVADNGQQAIDRYQSDYAQLNMVLMDCEMPVVDGLDATKSIREFEATNTLDRLPIYAITAHAFEDNLQQCLDAGMNACITKPIKLAELTEAIIACQDVVSDVVDS